MFAGSAQIDGEMNSRVFSLMQVWLVSITVGGHPGRSISIVLQIRFDNSKPLFAPPTLEY